ncbi:hypothetical protein SPRG_14125 [Saprolegnia parasitica CBS 223.65]|uniref:Uncharacterized protein n=1 Tax=Saprolegnia parasitica (strain CBS 223.65) TaxID=695850 RepID=A0A067BQV4_SAPPC|nr:hypothetical protein SPRG_14125 [Saprolegnia parasitica CBS 223.65]KDO20894.1 hypothetical protein SPRG_14125 [Saprolegnia parasitica CBS 223.65]|eukprot:XP_012208383.1 hypothetical protein SPRG_14125 [Saprolegnia parasitica CBS 223.65]
MNVTKRLKPTGPEPAALPQDLLEKILGYLDMHTTFFAALDALPTVARNPFLLALSTLRHECPPWLLWPMLYVRDVSAETAGLRAVFECALSSHPRVQLESNSPVRYFDMASGDVHLTVDAVVLVHLSAASLATVTDLTVDMTEGQSLQGVAAHLAHARHLRSLCLSLNIRELAQEDTLPILRETVSFSLRSMHLKLLGDRTPFVDEAMSRLLAQALVSFPAMSRYLAARLLYDAIEDARKLHSVHFFASSDLACLLSAFGQPWTCHRLHEHGTRCNERATASAEQVFPKIKAWTIEPRSSETSRALRSLAVMTSARRCSMTFWGELDETDFVTELLPRLGRLSRVQSVALSGGQLFENASRISPLIETLRGLRHLTSLRLSYTGLTSDGLRSLLPLVAAHPQLAHLYLSGNDLADDAVPLLKQVIATSQIQSLWITSNELTDDAQDELLDYTRQLRRSPLYLALTLIDCCENEGE